MTLEGMIIELAELDAFYIASQRGADELFDEAYGRTLLYWRNAPESAVRATWHTEIGRYMGNV